jgi:hypothetical protein
VVTSPPVCSSRARVSTQRVLSSIFHSNLQGGFRSAAKLRDVHHHVCTVSPIPRSLAGTASSRCLAKRSSSLCLSGLRGTGVTHAQPVLARDAFEDSNGRRLNAEINTMDPRVHPSLSVGDILIGSSRLKRAAGTARILYFPDCFSEVLCGYRVSKHTWAPNEYQNGKWEERRQHAITC